jgi:hypothetical protein
MSHLDVGVNFAGKTEEDLLCVNVGKKVNPRDSMQNQSLKGAVWISAGLLEIIPFQPMNSGLSVDHTAQMIRHAVRLPAANADES